MEIVSFDGALPAVDGVNRSAKLELTIGSVKLPIQLPNLSARYGAYVTQGTPNPRVVIFPGPCSLRIFSDSINYEVNPPAWQETTAFTDGGILVYRLFKNQEQGSNSAGTVEIPAGANGVVSVILETSTDLLNWVPAAPGDYGAGPENRFFRVRAEKEP